MTMAKPAPYLDSHCHVQARQFNNDRTAVIDRALSAGVGTLVCASDDEASSRDAIVLATARPEVWATVGIHPHEATTADKGALERLAEIARSPRVVAYGEIGLDYFRDLSPRDVQRDAFARQLELAGSLGLPVVVHSRDAAEDTYTILQTWRAAGLEHARAPGVIHCFGYDAGWSERFLGLGFLISIPGTVTYPKAEQLKQVAASVPDAMLLVETDCPYLTPQPWRGKRNEPAYLVETVREVAALRSADPVAVGIVTANNARRLFGLEVPVAAMQGAKGSS
ncbi:MAG: TatD family hydrolase [Dehalococcoidia bacterium]